MEQKNGEEEKFARVPSYGEYEGKRRENEGEMGAAVWVLGVGEAGVCLGGGEKERAMERERSGKNGEEMKWGRRPTLGNGRKI